jgi:hypothetical protein
MKQKQTLKRPNRFLDAMALETWAIEFHKDTFEEWELALPDNGGDSSFWEWLEMNHPGIFEKFKKNFERAMPQMETI